MFRSIEKLFGIFSEKEFKEIMVLFGVFALVLGFITLVLYPQGITYGKYPLLYFPIFIFSMVLVYECAPETVSRVRISNTGAVVTTVLVVAGLVSVWPSGAFVERSIKLIEILFQDLVIAAVLGVIGHRLANTKIRLALAIAFTVLHIPLFFVATLSYSLTVVVAAFLVSYIGTLWFEKTNQNIATIMIMHLSFYIIFGSILSVIVW
jgi:hypothetical protein